MTLYIDNQPCPVEPIKWLPLLYSSQKLCNPQLLREGIEVEVIVPATDLSNVILGSSRDIYAAERFNSSHHTARIEHLGVTIIEGTVYILSTHLESNLPGYYTLKIVESENPWTNRAARTALSSCGIDWSMELTTDNIKASWDTETHQPVRYLPVLRNRYSPQYSEVSGAPLENIMTTDDYHPYFSVYTLFKRIFDGYALHGYFCNSAEFTSLYMSGQYASPETAKQKMLLDFLARRSAPVTATADEYGAVYATVSFEGESALGNIVDTANPTAIDSEGKSMQDTFTTGNVFGIDEQGYCRFESSMSANVGFILHLEYITSYYIESRKSLRGFNHIVAQPDVDITFNIANTFKDRRNALFPGMTYNLCIFDFTESGMYLFQIFDKETGEKLSSQVVTDRFSTVTMPLGHTNLRCELADMAGEKEGVEVDWALYNTYISERGETEVVVDVRIPPQHFSPGEVERFNHIRFKGAEPGMKITLSTATSLRPYFSTVPGYGSTVTVADISHNRIWLIDVAEAIFKMFNLMVFTDHKLRRVLIEPMEEFYTGKVWDWSQRVDMSSALILSDAGVEEPQWVEHRYIEADYATKSYNKANDTDFGSWKVENPTYGAKNSTKSIVNPLFTTGINKTDIYAPAPSASIMQVGDNAAEGSMDTPFTTHIVRYAGVVPLPEDEIWGASALENKYPLAAFFFEGDSNTEPFSLCFEDRQGIQGLNRYFTAQAYRTAHAVRLKAAVRLSIAELEALLSLETEMATIRDSFILDTLPQRGRFRIESIEKYDLERQLAICTFISEEYE